LASKLVLYAGIERGFCLVAKALNKFQNKRKTRLILGFLSGQRDPKSRESIINHLLGSSKSQQQKNKFWLLNRMESLR
jgi:hypothetical protein